MQQTIENCTDRNEYVKKLMALAKIFARKHGRIGIVDEDDIAQAAVLKVITRPRGSIPAGWLAKVVHSVAMDARRDYSRRAKYLAKISNEDFAGGVCELADEGGYVPLEMSYVPAGDDRQPDLMPYLRKVLGQMPTALSQVLELYAQGASYEDIATVTNVNIGTVRSRLYRARRLAQKLIEPAML